MEFIKNYKNLKIYKTKDDYFCIDKNTNVDDVDIDILEKKLSEKQLDLYIDNSMGLLYNNILDLEYDIDKWYTFVIMQPYREVIENAKQKDFENMVDYFENNIEQFEKNFLNI